MKTHSLKFGATSKRNRSQMWNFLARPVLALTVLLLPCTSNASWMTSPTFSSLEYDGNGDTVVSASQMTLSQTSCSSCPIQTSHASAMTSTSSNNPTTPAESCQQRQTGRHNLTLISRILSCQDHGIGRRSRREHRFPIIRRIIIRRLDVWHEDSHNGH